MNVENSPKGTDAVEEIRESSREASFLERKHNREITLNKNRVALGEVVTDACFTPEFVRVKAIALKKKQLSLEEYRQLQNALIQSERNISSFLKVDNIMYSLIRDLSGKNQALNLYALNCSCNIALGNETVCQTLCTRVAPYLIAELDSLNRPLLETAAWTIGNLVIGSKGAFQILHAQNCFKYLIVLLRDCDDTILPSIAYATLRYVYAGFHEIAIPDLMQLAEVVVKKDFVREDPSLIWLIALLSSVEACHKYLHNVAFLILKHLQQCLANESLAVIEVTACVRVLANMVCGSTELGNALLNETVLTRSDLAVLFEKLLSYPHGHVRRETSWLIGNMYNHTSPDIREKTKERFPLTE